MGLTNKLLLAVSLFSLMILIYQFWITTPELSEYASKAYLFQEPSEGNKWKDWVLEAREMYWKTLIGLMLHTCFYISITIWGLAKTIGNKFRSPLKPKNNKKFEKKDSVVN